MVVKAASKTEKPIVKKLEEQQKESMKELSEDISLLTEKEAHTSTPPSDGKNVLILIGILLAVFAVVIGGFKTYNHFAPAAVVVIDDLHKDNLDGKLDQDQGYVYNGFSFVKADGLWWTSVEVSDRIIKVPMHYGPKDVETIPVSGKLTPEFNKGEKIYVSIDPTINYDKYYTLGLMELNTNILQGARRNIEAACSKENTVCENRTIINCENNPLHQPVVQLVRDEKASVQLTGSCIKISGKDEDFVKAVDKVLYGWYKVFG